MCDGFHDIRGNQHLEAKQKRSANADLVYLGILMRYWLSEMEIGGPCDAAHDDEHAKNLDAAPDHPNGVIGEGFQAFEGGRFIHIGIVILASRST